MSRAYKRKGRDHFVQLHEWMIRSPAWASLDCVSRLAYVELKRRYDGFNNGRIGRRDFEPGGKRHHLVAEGGL